MMMHVVRNRCLHGVRFIDAAWLIRQRGFGHFSLLTLDGPLGNLRHPPGRVAATLDLTRMPHAAARYLSSAIEGQLLEQAPPIAIRSLYMSRTDVRRLNQNGGTQCERSAWSLWRVSCFRLHCGAPMVMAMQENG
jgi:hypothetical protein